MDQKRLLPVATSSIRRTAAQFALCMTFLILPGISHAGYVEFDYSGTTTLSDIKKGQRVTAQVSYIAPEDPTDDSAEGEALVTSVQVTGLGSGAITVNSQSSVKKITFIATQDAPAITVTLNYSGTGTTASDGDEGGALLTWRGIDKDSGDPPCDGKCGDPINALTGNSFQKEVDYVGAGDFPLTFVRYYNSINKDRALAFGSAWSHSYNNYIDSLGSLVRAEGPKYGISPYGFDPDAPIVQVNFSGCTGNCYLNKQTNILESYDAVSSRLLAIYDLKGNSQTMAYDSVGNLLSVTHSNGRALTFTYDSMNRIATMTDPSGAVYSYTYDANNNLASVTHPDSGIRQYVYGNASFPNAMTGLIDELGNTYATWTYDANGYAITSSVGGGLVVESASSPDVTTDIHTVTNGAGTTRTLTAAYVNGKQMPGITTFAASGSPSVTGHSAVYSVSNKVLERTNNNGSVDCFNYNNKSQETAAVYNGIYSYSTCSTQTNSILTTTTWHPNIYAKASVAEPYKLSYFVYHQQPDPTNGNALASCITPANSAFAPYLNIICKTAVYGTTGTAGSAINTYVPADIHTYTYDPSGRVLTDTDSRGSITTYTYYQDSTTGHTAGDIQSVTDSLGHVTNFNLYDKNGRVLQSTDPNGLVSNFTYDYRGNMLSRTVGALTTNYVYDSVGQLTSVQAADGTKTTNLYDLAHRVSKTSDNAGNSVNFAYDSVGNIATVTLKDNLGNTAKTSQYFYDYMNNIVKSIGDSK
jgi:YD repeat-containing protein